MKTAREPFESILEGVDPNSEKKRRKEIKLAERRLPPSVLRLLREGFGLKGMEFFRFYVLMDKIRRGMAPPEDLKRQYNLAANRLTQVKGTHGNGISPAGLNAVALTRSLMYRTFKRIRENRMNPIYWRQFNETYIPLMIQVSHDAGVYIKTFNQRGSEQWSYFRKMSKTQTKIEKMKDVHPENYALLTRMQKSMSEIDAEILKNIEDGGFEFKRGFLAGRPVSIGVDPNTQEERIYDRDGDILTKQEFFEKLNDRKAAKERLSRVPNKTQVPIEEIRRLDDEDLENLEGSIQWDAITDDKAKQGRLTRLFPTKKARRLISDPERGLIEEHLKVVVQGRYKGCYLDDLINSEGRLIEGTAYGFDPESERSRKVPQRIDPSDREPYVSVAEVDETFTFRGKKMTRTKKKLYLKINGDRKNTVLRHAVKALACNTGRKSGCIPSVTYERVEGSRAAGFYFDPKDFGVIMESLQGMSLSAAALQEVQGYFRDLTQADEATKHLEPYSTQSLATENDDDERFAFIQGSFRNGEYQSFDLREKQKEVIAWMDAKGGGGVCGLDTGIGKCVTENTLIVTTNGLVPIGDLNPGVDTDDTYVPVDNWEVLVDGKALPVKNFYYGGKKATRKIRSGMGFEVEGSLNHPLLSRTVSGQEVWIKTPELEVGDYLCVERKEGSFPLSEPSLKVPTRLQPSEKTYPVPTEMNPSLARLCGYLVAEGYVRGGRRFTLNQDPQLNPQIRQDMKDLVASQLGYTLDLGERMEMNVSSTFLCRYLDAMGLLPKEGAFPRAILQATKPSVREFLRGFVDAKGHIRSLGIEVSTASDQIASQLQYLLLRFGVVAKKSSKFVEGSDHKSWKLNIQGEDARTFMAEIGLVSDRNIAKATETFMSHTNNLNEDTIPHLAALMGEYQGEIFKAFGGNTTAFRAKYGSSLQDTMNRVRFGRQNASYGSIKGLLHLGAEIGCQETASFQRLSKIHQRRFFYDKIVSIEESENIVVDIEVDDPSHCFVGNGLMNHNTSTSIASMLMNVRNGQLEEGAGYQTPDGGFVETNGRFLFVCPTSLRGNIKKEVRDLTQMSSAILDRLDVLSYNQFSRASSSGKVPKPLQKVAFWKNRMAQGGSSKQASKEWDASLYVALYFDEAHAMKKITTKSAQAALKLWHPRKVCLTASPMERDPMESYVLAAISGNVPLYGKSLEAKENRKEMRRFKERFCEIVGGRIVGVKQDPLVKRDLHTWMKKNVFYAHKTELKEAPLPALSPQTKAVVMDEEVEALYKDIAGEFGTIMQGAARKFSTRKKNDNYADRQAERLFTMAMRPVIKLMNLLSNRPADAMEEIAFIVKKGYIRGQVTKSGKPRAIPRNLQRLFKRWQDSLDANELKAKAKVMGNPKLESMSDWISTKIDAERGSRTLIFTDDKVLCMNAAEHMSRRVSGVHVCALNDSIYFFRAGRNLKEWTIPIDRGVVNRVLKNPESQKAYLTEMKGKATHKLPIRQKNHKLYPRLPGKQGVHNAYTKGEWQQFALKELIRDNPAIVSCTLLGKTYSHGHNLQTFNTVIHLDRNNWNSEAMKQRTARAWRQGQKEEVDEVTFDAAYSGENEDNPNEWDQTLDQIRKAFQEMDAAIFDNIIRDAQDIELGGEWKGVEGNDASLYNLDMDVAEMMASPYLGRIAKP